MVGGKDGKGGGGGLVDGFTFGDAGPIVGSERHGRQSCRIGEVTGGVVRPGVSYCFGSRYFIAMNNYFVAGRNGVRPIELSILTCDGKAGDGFAILCCQPRTSVGEADAHPVALDGVMLIGRSRCKTG